jgi:hypothetical protein
MSRRYASSSSSGWSTNDQVYDVANIVEFRDGRIWRETRYYAAPFDPPDWRSQWVEPIEEC